MLSHSLFEDHAAIATGPERVAFSIERVLRAAGTRSELRELVERFADLARLVGVPLQVALVQLDAVATRAASAMSAAPGAPAVGDSVADRRAMMARWCSARYQRAD